MTTLADQSRFSGLIVSDPAPDPGSEQDAGDFDRALPALHALIGIELEIDLWFRDHFFAVDFSSRLLRVETLPDSQSVIAYFENGVNIYLAPNEQIPSETEGVLSFAVGEELVLELSPVGHS